MDVGASDAGGFLDATPGNETRPTDPTRLNLSSSSTAAVAAASSDTQFLGDGMTITCVVVGR